MSFQLVIVSPRGCYFDEKVESLTIKLSSGYRTILAHHAPLIGAIAYAPMHIVKDGKTIYYALHGGAINIDEEKVTLMVNAIEREDEIDLKRALEAKKRAEERLKSRGVGIDIKRAQLALYRALSRIETKQH